MLHLYLFPSFLQGVVLSVDTFYSHVAREAISAGVSMVNDVSGGLLDTEMLRTVADFAGVSYVVMHMRGDPTTMQDRINTTYTDLVPDIARALGERCSAAVEAGIEPWRLVLDPGIGFAKTPVDNLKLIAGLERFRAHLPAGCLQRAPILVGPSRKGFLGRLTGRADPKDRDWATAGAAVACVERGADIIRVHNVKGVRDAVRVADSVRRGRWR